jgi:hypothetical protein
LSSYENLGKTKNKSFIFEWIELLILFYALFLILKELGGRYSLDVGQIPDGMTSDEPFE